jgi:two-component system sensor histidine kinase AlgZ
MPERAPPSATETLARPIPGPSGFGVDAPSAFGFADVGAEGEASAKPRRRAAFDMASPFDVCHVGVVLRAVLFIHVVVAIGTAFAATSLGAWLSLFALGTVVALPGLLLWLIVACLLKRSLASLSPSLQWLAALSLGALSGAAGWSQLWLSGLAVPVTVGSAGLAGSGSWAAAVLAGVAFSAAIFYWLTLRAQSQLPADQAARLAELQSRIRPHFLFNTLNTAIALARVDPARTEGLLEDLAELFRVALSDTGVSVSLADEVDLAQRYLAIEQIRFGDRLRVTWELDPAAGAARVPPLMLQPLVENAVRHGVEPSAGGGTIRVRTRVERGQVVIAIANSVPRGRARPGNGIALRNVQERLRLMHDVSAKFQATLDGDVHRVQIVVPL